MRSISDIHLYSSDVTIQKAQYGQVYCKQLTSPHKDMGIYDIYNMVILSNSSHFFNNPV